MTAAKTHVQLDDLPGITALLDRAWQGDRGAEAEFIALVYHHVEHLVRRVRRRYPGARQLESTEADTQEVLLRVLFARRGGRSRFASRGEFVSACFVAARNLLIDRLRRAQIRKQVTLEGDPGLPTTTVSVAARQVELEELELLDVVLNELSDEDYALVSLVYFAGLPMIKASSLLGLAESSGRDRMRRIKRQLGAEVRRLEGRGSL